MEKNTKLEKLYFTWLPVSCFLLLATCLFPLHTFAQEFGGNPPSMKWKQVNTRISRIIFPEGLDSQALEVNSIIQRLDRISRVSSSTPRKIDIVLQTQPTYSNGYVGLGPFRSEFYLTPRQNSFELGSLPWHKKLALHEYRHVQQFSNFRRGISRIAYYLFGEEGQALANSVAVPDWFWEGDAVYQETVMSRQGRGRLPYFFNGYRSLWATGINYSWMKLRNGSYRDYVPDHYQLGYILVNFGNYKYGDEAWQKITADAAAFKGIFFPFQKAFRRHTGQSFRAFRQEALGHFSGAADKGLMDSVAIQAARDRHFRSDEMYPQWINGEELVYLKSTFSRIPAFYTRNVITGAERKIRDRGVSTATYFSANKNRIVYTSFVPHARWGWKNYEAITIVDIASGGEKRITSGTRYLSPSISEDGSLVVAVNSGTGGNTSLHVIDGTSGRLLKEVPASPNYVYTYPVFLNPDTVISAVRNEAGEMALGKFSISDGAVAWVTPFTIDPIGFPRVQGDTIYFSKTEREQDRLYVALKDGTVKEFYPAVQNASTGNYHLTGLNGRYSWTSFTSSGFRLYHGTGSLSSALSHAAVFAMNAPATKADLITSADSTSPRISAYPAGYRLFNFHSWRPYFVDPEYTYSVVGNNVLNTVSSEVYFTYNRNERFKETGAVISYAGLFPVFSGGASFTFDRSFTDTARRTTWNEFNARFGIGIPLQFTSGAFNQSLSFGTAFNTKQVYYTGASKQLFETKKFNYGEVTISAVNQQLRARQNIYPRIAQSLFLRHRQILNNYKAHQFLVSGSIYVPGFSRNHNVILQFAYQQRDTMQQYVFPNSFPVSRGYPDIDFPRMWKAGVNYHLPLWYPDAGTANIVYLLRVRSNCFYDMSKVKSLRTGTTFTLDAAGMEIYFDTRWWNQLPVTFGVRYSHLLDADLVGISPHQWELVLPVGLFTR